MLNGTLPTRHAPSPQTHHARGAWRARLAFVCLLTSALHARTLAAAPGDAAPAGVRLLVLDLRVAPDAPVLADDDRALLEGLVDEALRNREGALWITAGDVRARAPMEADRLPTCADPACLFELASVVDADFVLIPMVAEWRADERQASLAFSLYDRVQADVVMRERVVLSDAGQLADRLRPALTRVLGPAFAGHARQKWQAPLFLAGGGVLSVGLAGAAGALGYAGELESALARPDVHRTRKQRALDEGPTVLAIAAGAGAVALAGALLMGISWLGADDGAPVPDGNE